VGYYGVAGILCADWQVLILFSYLSANFSAFSNIALGKFMYRNNLIAFLVFDIP
jgi:hypothetical protein